MSPISLKKQTLDPALKPNSPASDAGLNGIVERMVTLAREARYVPPSSEETPRVFPNFTLFLKISGRWLLISDMASLLIAFIAGGFTAKAIDILLLGGVFQDLFSISTAQQFGIFGGVSLASLLWFESEGHYRQRLPYWETVGHILAIAGLGFLAGGFLQFAIKGESSRLWMGLSWAFFATFLFMGRHCVRHALDRRNQWQIPALVVGKGPTAQAALKALTRERQMGFTVVGQIPAAALEDLTKPHAWRHLLMIHGACHIFMALEGGDLQRHSPALKTLTRTRVPCSIIPPWLGLPSSTLSPHHFMMNDVMMLHDTNRLQLPLLRFLKRSVDIILAGSALIALAPLFAVVALAVRRDGGPALFTQARVGRGGAHFDCYKFRSMHIHGDEILARHLAQSPEAATEWQHFQKLKNDVRVTAMGHFIRRTSIDDLPQLINVIKGEMSLVGPRPCMPGQEQFYAEDFSLYESVRPGITGPWQVSGRSKLNFKERVALEAWYARNWSLWLDIVIILKTIPTLLERGQAFLETRCAFKA